MKTEVFVTERKLNERALRESEQRYKRLLAATSDYIYSVEVDHGRSGRTSHGLGCEAVTGYSPAEFDADPFLWYRVIYEDDRPAVLKQAARILRGESPPPIEHRLIHRDGNTRWVRNTPIPHTDEHGHLVAYDGVISEITNRKRAEQLLSVQCAVTSELVAARSLQDVLPGLLQSVCELMLWDSAAFWDLAPDARVLFCRAIWHRPHAGVEDFAEVSRKLTYAPGIGLPGRVWSTAEPIWIPDVAIEDSFARGPLAAHVGLRCGCAAPICLGREVVGVIELFSREVQQQDAHMLAVLRAVGDQISQFIERQRSEEALASERNLLRTLIDNLPSYVYVKDRDSRFLLNNRAHARILGAEDPQQVLGKSDLDIFPRELALRYRADEEAVLESGLPLVNHEEATVDPQGRTQWVLTTKVPLKDRDSRICGLVGVSHDITERKQSEERLRSACNELAAKDQSLHQALQELQRAHDVLKQTQLQLIQAAKLESVGTLAAGVAHEVKNPLQTILMGLDCLVRKLPARDQDLDLTLSEMRDAVKRANGIIQELLALSAARDFDLKPEELNSILERSLWLVRNELMASGVDVVRQFAVGLPAVRVDRNKLEQVFVNLFLNALHAMPHGGTLTVTTRRLDLDGSPLSPGSVYRSFQPGDRLLVAEVQDTGPGIPGALLPRIFDPFFTTKPQGVGTGLGLPVARNIIDLHGGAIDLGNAAPAGAVATVVLKIE